MAEGNVLVAPGFGSRSEAGTRELMYSMKGYTQKGVTLKSGQGLLPAGTPLVRSGEGDYAAATVSGGTVTGTVEGFLRQATDTGTAGDPANPQKMGNIVLFGAIKVLPETSYVADTDAAAVAEAVGGRYDSTRKVIFF